MYNAPQISLYQSKAHPSPYSVLEEIAIGLTDLKQWDIEWYYNKIFFECKDILSQSEKILREFLMETALTSSEAPVAKISPKVSQAPSGTPNIPHLTPPVISNEIGALRAAKRAACQEES